MATVLGNPFSTCTKCVFFAVHETNAPVSLKLVDFSKGAQKDPEYISKYQPFGKVPVFVDGDFKIFESRAIARYINNTYGGHLIPKDNKIAAVMDQWIAIEHGTMYPELCNLLTATVWGPMHGRPKDDEKGIAAAEKLATALDYLEATLSDGRQYIAGDLSLVDIYFTPYMAQASTTAAANTMFNSRPHVKAWIERLTSRPAWLKTLAMEKTQ